MAVIRPFCAYRPAKGWEDKIAALPYDVYDREEACAVVAQNPMSFLAIDRAETQFGPEVDTYAPEVYEKAAQMLEEQIREGRFVREEKPCYYLYEQTMNGRSQTGIVACASIDDYCNNVIKKHENTRADKEQDRIRHVDVCNMQTGPIFLAYRANTALRELTETVKEQDALYDFVSEDQVRHRVWVIGEEERIALIADTFAGIPGIYIADGHHRCASAVKVGLKRRESHADHDGSEEFNYFLSVLFPDEELRILDYNRVVKDLNGLSREEFLDRVSAHFEIRRESDDLRGKGYAPTKKGEFGMYLDGAWYCLTAGPEICSADAVAGLDVSILQDHLLAPILGIGDPKTDKRIDFVGGIRGLAELERRCTAEHPGEEAGMRVAFSLYPTSIAELFAVADAGRLMPPKSTWFEPKLRSGLFLHQI
ncbi:MAG: DUF1015 family protein [Clostridium sp.]|nr:DUF1015 family protein [Acetatifactor muris]MCM1527122.1 DUF1015 family protein [Bacteroides sp.]MCM1563437.1 DUF1015 family protein [Clostridium sp.]